MRRLKLPPGGTDTRHMGSSLISALRRPFARLAKGRLADESGWLIVEIMIGAVVLVITALGIYAGLDGASKTSGHNRNRSVAAYLAQQDQERLRTKDAAALAGTTETRVVPVAGVKYTVTSTATYVNDSSGAISCTNKAGTAQYLRIRSSVADPTGANAPVVQDSLLSPKPDDGNAAVKVVGRDGTTGVGGIPVALAEPPGTSVTTDSTNGCSLFTFLDNGTQYHVGFAVTGYVDVNGVNSVTGPITVVPGTVSVTSFQYDQAGTINATYPGACTDLSVSDSHMTINPRVRSFPGSGCSGTVGPNMTNQATNLFPFTDNYSVYAGSCQSNDPTRQSPAQTARFTTNPLTAGGSQAVTLIEPTVSLTVRKKTTTSGSGTRLANARVVATETDCAANNPLRGLPVSNGNTTGTNWSFGLPYGTFTICADDGSHHSVTQPSVQNTTSAGTSATVTIDTTQSGNSGTCP